MIAFIEECRDEFSVGSICSVLPIAPSSYYAQLAVRRDPSRASKRAQQDERDSREIRRALSESGGRFGARKVWHALRREGYDIARRIVERLMKVMGL
ncbi:Integrase, catalytic region [Mameliella alba]|uniref:Integrase, catalytic region n=1 Tax=Mameliella alba TaxID=561184 RepID=A0A0B3SGF5_9RHOB|nr:Integrase, catalytic region [Mameliella alba]